MAVIICQIFRCLGSLLLLQLADSNSNTADICQERTVAGHQANLNVNTSLIAETNGYCSCRIISDVTVNIQVIFHDVKSPDCATTIQLLTDSFMSIASCENESYTGFVFPKSPFLVAKHDIWLTVKSNRSPEEQMSGSIQIENRDLNGNKVFSLECFKPNTNSSSMTTLTTRETSIVTSSNRLSSTQVHSKITEERSDTMPINEQQTDDGQSNLPVPLIAGCASGSVILLIVLVIVAVACHRRGRTKPKLGKNKNMTKYSDDEYLSMENDLYVSSADLDCTPYPHQSTLRDSSNVGIYSSQGHLTAEGMKTGYLQAPNGDLYAFVHKPRNVQGESR